MAIQVFTVDEGIQVDNGSGTTVWDVDNTGAMTVAATTVLEVNCLDPPVPKSIVGTESISVVSS